MAGPLHAGGFPQALVDALLDDALARPDVPVAIAGPQGSGKSTLASQLAGALAQRGGRAAVLSLDDVYLDRPARLALARTVHPLLATRGPPGTHDPALACAVIDSLLAGRPTRLPRFDKALDRRMPDAGREVVERADLVILEGWCLRLPPEPEQALAPALNALERREDADGRWRRYCNDALARHYTALWARLPRLVWLAPPSFDVVPRWRWEQEQALARARPGAGTMDRAAVARFVQHFERLTRHAMRCLPAMTDVRIDLDDDRLPRGVAWATPGPRGAPPTIGA